MPLLLSDRAATTSPLPLMTWTEGRMLGVRPSPQRWTRLRRGVYVDRAAYGRLPPWKKYVVRVHAFVRMHPDAVLCLESAAVAHGLPLFGEPEYIHVFDPGRAGSRRFGDVFVHASVDPREVVMLDGVLATSVADTVVDLARVLPPAESLAVADSAISPTQGGLLTLEQLRALGDAQQNRRGRARLRWTWAHADGRSESPAESVSRAVIRWSGFEEPDLQREFRYEGHEDRVDFHFRSCRAIGEADGWQKYRLETPERAAQLLAEEKRREDRLRRHGHPFAQWEPADAWKRSPLVRSLELAGVPRVAPAQSAMLATLTQRPRAKTVPRRTDG